MALLIADGSASSPVTAVAVALIALLGVSLAAIQARRRRLRQTEDHAEDHTEDHAEHSIEDGREDPPSARR